MEIGPEAIQPLVSQGHSRFTLRDIGANSRFSLRDIGSPGGGLLDDRPPVLNTKRPGGWAVAAELSCSQVHCTQTPARHHKIFAHTQQGTKPACQQDINANFLHLQLAQLPRTQVTHRAAKSDLADVAGA